MNTHVPSDNYELILKNVSRFIDLTKEEVELFKSLFSLETVKRRSYLSTPGEIIRFDYFVVKGCLKVYTVDMDGNEHISMFAIEDFWTGDLASFVEQQPATYFIKALEDSEVLRISRPNYDLLMEKIPKFERFYRILYQRSLINYIKRTNQGISLTAEERYERFLKQFPHIVNRISQKNLAAYLGITPVFLSMIRKKISQG